MPFGCVLFLLSIVFWWWSSSSYNRVYDLYNIVTKCSIFVLVITQDFSKELSLKEFYVVQK